MSSKVAGTPSTGRLHRVPSHHEMSRFLRRGLPNRVDVTAPLANRKTKIICTIGPSCQSVEMLKKLLAAGMNIARLNFSHGSYKYHAESIANIRAASDATGIPVAIMLDTKGPEIRTLKLKGGKPVMLQEGQKLLIKCTSDREFEGDGTSFIGIDYVNLPKVVKPGSTIRIADGVLNLSVVRIDGNEVETIVQNAAEIGENKGCNLPGCNVDLPALSEKDVADLKFGADQGVDFIAASFARSGQGVDDIREVLGTKGANVKIISKIESEQGLNHFDEILARSDGIMVARGDMGVEIPIQKVCMAQKRMIRECNIAGKPVVTATQMLESMITNPRPTRAEATDVANAVFDGTDCVMLSGETAKGQFPVEAVTVMARICVTSELAIDHNAMFESILTLTPKPLTRAEAISSSAVKVDINLDAAIIVVLTESGASARFVAKYRPSIPVLTLTTDKTVYRQTLASRALWPMLVQGGKSDDEMMQDAIAYAQKNKWVAVDDWVIVVSGTQGIQGSAHTLRVVRVQ
ncbi:Pyruvate kinase [Plasmodiophora brassicae]|uniref:Pyruvate kinase n=1 Tax=Plasmodiophora brassicae TaxID=37360 RepID=A0A0G4IIJ5_PLABS|nr:hypothetical protein PBRA_003722 [Plasmodiophora brassicae]SPQ94242.1 unnamed protein product [Plasmodiophora brassicae]